ncbi:MAG: nitrilase-related carbon-nitrogen hydrolase, partial [Bacilli bacterium]
MAANKLKVALVQASPIMFNLQATIDKVGVLVSKAAKANASLVVFSEAFIPCYPLGLSFGSSVGKISKEGLDDWLL